jgi:adenylate kinase family enzyme
LAARLNCPHIDLDELFWGPGWTPAPREVFRARVAALAGPRWAVGGNYSAARDLVWARADTLVWLDYPLPMVLGRLLRRTVRRLVTREMLWAGNHETWRAQFFSRDSLCLWALHAHPRQRREYPLTLARPEYAHLAWVRLHSPREAQAWLEAAG